MMERPDELLTRREISKKIIELQMYVVQGDAHSDRPGFDLANEIIYSAYQQGLNFMALRALSEIDRIMGIELIDQTVTMEDLRDYVHTAGWN